VLLILVPAGRRRPCLRHHAGDAVLFNARRSVLNPQLASGDAAQPRHGRRKCYISSSNAHRRVHLIPDQLLSINRVQPLKKLIGAFGDHSKPARHG
jgi:hypothetical protein